MWVRRSRQASILLVLLVAMTSWATGVAATQAPRDEINIRVAPANPARGSQVTLFARGLPVSKRVEAGLRTPDGRRELLQYAWTGPQGDLQVKVSLPESASPGETWLGVVKVQAGEEIQFLSANQITVARGAYTYRVRPGDTLGEIAGWFRTKISHLLDANPQIKRTNRIVAGQELIVPVGSADVNRVSAGAVYRIPDYDGSDWKRSVVNGVFGRVWEEIQGERRWIEVDLSEQEVRAYQGTELVRTFVVSTGRPRTPTVTGSYYIYTKHLAVDMSGPGYHLEDVPFTMYFYQGYGLHGTYWHNNFGRTMSHGCVNLSIADAEWLYGFTSIGTLVHVHQ